MQELAKTLNSIPQFAQFKEYIAGKIAELDSIEGLEGLSNEKAGEEAKARGIAMDKLYDIFSPFVVRPEKHEPTDEEIANVKKRVGLS